MRDLDENFEFWFLVIVGFVNGFIGNTIESSIFICSAVIFNAIKTIGKDK